MVNNIGLITYHSAYNYGSVLQALATQLAVSNFGYDVKVIDYRPHLGDVFYKTLYRTHDGLSTLLADLTMLPVANKRLKRNTLFESFIQKNLNLTSDRFENPSDLSLLRDSFDLVISGSDQIINKHSNELEKAEWSAMDPYLLTWTNSPKITYASSPATMTDAELELIAPKLKNFKHISVREENANKRLSNVTDKKITTVCDPTLLIRPKEWRKFSHTLTNKKKYILFYSLIRPKRSFPIFSRLSQLSVRTGLPVYILTPLAGFVPPNKHLVNVLASGPAEFLSLVDNAEMVITDSYHGTLFSINFNKDFWMFTENSYEYEIGTRKGQILSKLNLTDRILNEKNIQDIDLSKKIQYDEVNVALDQYVTESLNYLRSSISD
ncbi:Polysaccharide pyruvyl transferase [Bifidobacterium goeldii]|uniref:Polysaccharide pyruvyl transferase n=1 Tax=Bifidobacterium goeldii TaxID=2306975 RepID=A0A430FFY9_9BIFI|nr:polysaccharide pyruvyl transferase family protein [Bifidobacterium goeldii]RSX51756.1 Polysaccharide pyruvyl transferase [Bifidobacterium goeldii]